MTITIENPTAETPCNVPLTVPAQELKRDDPLVDEGTEWSDEDLRDFSDASFALVEERCEEEGVQTRLRRIG